MEEIYKDIRNMLIDKDYGKILKVSIFLFILFVPSTILLFLFNRELFISLDTIKLIFLCVVLNIVFFSGVFIFELMCRRYKFSEYASNINKVIDKEINSKKNNKKKNKTKENDKEINVIFEKKETQETIDGVYNEFYAFLIIETLIIIIVITVGLLSVIIVDKFLGFNTNLYETFVFTLLLILFIICNSSIIEGCNVIKKKKNIKLSILSHVLPIIFIGITILLIFLIYLYKQLNLG